MQVPFLVTTSLRSIEGISIQVLRGLQVLTLFQDFALVGDMGICLKPNIQKNGA